MTEAATGPGGLNRRRSERVPMPPTGGAVAVVGARIVNVSPYGMMIESPLPMNTDSTIPFRLVVAGRKADVECRVAACVASPTNKRRYNVGLEFITIADDVQEGIRAELRKLAQPSAPPE